MAIKNIIIAEDSSVLQNLIKKILIQIDCVTKGVKNGEALLNELENNQYDLILLDINIPKKNGIECAEIIRESKTSDELPIIAVTGNADNLSDIEFNDLGFNDVILKPIDFDNLVVTVEKWLKR
jgi:two-component system cell cycle response regulator DivK